MGNPSRVRVTGPLEPYAAGFASELARGGYTRHSTSHQLRVFAHLSRWLAAESLDPAELTPSVGDAFLTARRAAGYTLWLSRKALQPLLKYLRALDVLPSEPTNPPSPTEAMLALFGEYLASERGLAPSTVNEYVYMVRPCLRTRESPNGALELKRPGCGRHHGFRGGQRSWTQRRLGQADGDRAAFFPWVPPRARRADQLVGLGGADHGGFSACRPSERAGRWSGAATAG